MDIDTKTFGTLTQDMFDTSCKYLKSVGTRLAFEFDTAVIFAVAAVFATGDVTHINKVLPLFKLAKLEPMFNRVVVAFNIIPFNYDSAASAYDGKIRVGDRATMETERDGIPQWEILLRAALDGEKPENKAKRSFNLESRMNNLVKLAREEGKTDTELASAYKAAKKNHPYVVAADSNMLSAEDQQRVKDNALRLDGEVKKAAAKAA